MASAKDMAEGKPLRVPLHSALVHLPIALLPISLVLDVVSWIVHTDGPKFVRAALVAVVAGIASGLLAAIFGWVDYRDIRRDHPAKSTATRHMIANLIALGLFAVSAVLRFRSLELDHTGIFPLVLSVLGLGALTYSGYLGGNLVYRDGIGVGRHRRRTDTPASTIEKTSAGRNATVADRFVSVAADDALGEGETLRVSVNGTVMAIARIEGALYAFQEFCTHRYGPLSEGALRGCEVVCPWHNSRFDVRTGKVMHGPAKVDLLTFKVETRDGFIWIEAPEDHTNPSR